MDKCTLCDLPATQSYHDWSLCSRCQHKGHDVLGIQLADHERSLRKRTEYERSNMGDKVRVRNEQVANLRNTVDEQSQELMVLQSKIAEFQNQWYVRPSLVSQLIDWFHEHKEKWYVQWLVLSLPLIPLAMAVHWYW